MYIHLCENCYKTFENCPILIKLTVPNRQISTYGRGERWGFFCRPGFPTQSNKMNFNYTVISYKM